MRRTIEPPTDPGAYAFRQRVRARFAETDAMGVVHHAAYLPWLEEARVALLRASGHPYAEIRAAGTDLAVIECHVAYRVPARFDDEIDVHCLVAPSSGASFEIAYLLRRGVETIALAVTVHACVDAATGRPQRPPGWVRDLATPLG
jgi:acyl-CoA thioester hydrolase